MTVFECRGVVVSVRVFLVLGFSIRWWGGSVGSRRGKCSWSCGSRIGRSLR